MLRSTSRPARTTARSLTGWVRLASGSADRTLPSLKRPSRPRPTVPTPKGQPMGLRCAIIGSGNIGTDLMMKIRRSEQLELAALIGIDPASDGLARARSLGVEATPDGIGWVAAHPEQVDLVLDATSAHVHVRHAAVLADL